MTENKPNQDFNIGDTISKAEEFINKNRKSLMIIGGAVVVAVAGFVYYQMYYVKNKHKETASQMYKAEEYFKNDSLKLAINGDGNFPGFEEIIESDGVSKAANLAHYYLGMSYLKSGEFEKAIETLSSYDGEDNITPSLALAGIGDAHMELGNIKEAISYYEKAAGEKPNNYSTPIMLMKLGTAYELDKNYNQAADVYRKLKKEYPSSTEGQQAEKYLSRAEALTSVK